MDACIMCGLTASDDDEMEISMESSKYMHWVHKSCLPPHYLMQKLMISSCPQNVLSISIIIIVKC